MLSKFLWSNYQIFIFLSKIIFLKKLNTLKIFQIHSKFQIRKRNATDRERKWVFLFNFWNACSSSKLNWQIYEASLPENEAHGSIKKISFTTKEAEKNLNHSNPRSNLSILSSSFSFIFINFRMCISYLYTKKKTISISLWLPNF